jgi:hypothetical protein
MGIFEKKKYGSSPKCWATVFLIREYVLILTKMGWVTFWAIFSQTHLGTLHTEIKNGRELDSFVIFNGGWGGLHFSTTATAIRSKVKYEAFYICTMYQLLFARPHDLWLKARMWSE